MAVGAGGDWDDGQGEDDGGEAWGVALISCRFLHCYVRLPSVAQCPVGMTAFCERERACRSNGHWQNLSRANRPSQSTPIECQYHATQSTMIWRFSIFLKA